MTLSERLQTFLGASPQIEATSYRAASAVILGDVRLGAKTSIWPQAVLRADINSILIGEGSNVQDGTVMHVADDFPVIVGRYVTIGHAAIIHACTIGDGCLIGMGATILDGAVIGENCLIGARALVTPRTQIPAGSLVLGSPAKVVRSLTEAELSQGRNLAMKYIEVAAAHQLLER